MSSRRDRRAAAAEDRRRRKAAGPEADWGEWKRTVQSVKPSSYPGAGVPSARSLAPMMMEAVINNRWTVIIRRLNEPSPSHWHFSVNATDGSGEEPTFYDLQRIKNEVAGPEWVAVQVYPRDDRLVDCGAAYHLWVYPPGHQLGFGLHPFDGAASIAPRRMTAERS